jgi:calcium-dependent protein kinase
MLFYDPNLRISAADALSHDWIRNNKSKGLINNSTLSKL